MPAEKKTGRWQALMTQAQIGLVQNITGASLLDTLGYHVHEQAGNVHNLPWRNPSPKFIVRYEKTGGCSR